MLEQFFNDIGFSRFSDNIEEILKEASNKALNTLKGNKTDCFRSELSLIRLDKFSNEVQVNGNVIAIDIGGSHTKVALKTQDEEIRILFDKNNDYFKEKKYEGRARLQIERFISVLVSEIKKAVGKGSHIKGVAIIWSNPTENFYIKRQGCKGISGVTVGIGQSLYTKNEWFFSDIENGVDIGENFIREFKEQGITISNIVIANDTVFTLKALEDADIGAVISTGANVTATTRDAIIYGTEAGAMLKVKKEYLSDIDPFQDGCMLQQFCAGAWQKEFLKAYIIGAVKSGETSLKNFSEALEKENFLKNEDISNAFFGKFDYEKNFKEAKEAFFAICKKIVERATLAGAVMLYCGVVSNENSLQQNKNKKIKIALDSAMARFIPTYYETLRKNLEKFISKDVELVLLYPQGQITVPIIGAFNAINKY